MSFSRRGFLKAGLGSLAFFTIESTTPNWIMRSANALGAAECLNGDRILVIIQLAGGNDGLNTIIPVTDPLYYSYRPKIAVTSSEAITMDSLNSMHPAMVALADRYQAGQFGVIQNVGYVNPNLSHFTSNEYFEHGYIPGEPRTRKGWAAKLYDNACGCQLPDESLYYLAAGTKRVPHSMERANCYTPAAVQNPDTYRLYGDTDEALRLAAITNLNKAPVLDPVLDFVQRSENIMEASIEDIATADEIDQLVPEGSYSKDSLGNGLALASKVIRRGFKTRIFYVRQGGFDTHANQVIDADPTKRGNHPRLLENFGKSVSAFLDEMEASGNLDKVMIMTFSEFGRRVEENSSLGTDHGAANSMMIFGGGINGGVYGGQPNLANLQRGNLRHDIDFRSVYSYVIEEWLGCDAEPIFGTTVYNDIIKPDMLKIPFLQPPASVKPKNWMHYQ